MARSDEGRIADVRRLLEAARAVHDDRGRIAPAIARSSGLTAQGVELGFASLETQASDAELRSLVAAAGRAPRVHVVLSANVFVAALRALALARAAAERVTVRPSPRDPALAHALVARAGDPALTLSDERDVAALECDEVHVYGRDATVAQVRARVRPGVVVRGHGAGMGVAVVSERADVDAAADAVTPDVVAFDQRGCLSPRVAFVAGGQGRAASFAAALHERLASWAGRVPRGTLTSDERIEAARWRDTVAFAGRLWNAEDHLVGLSAAGAPLLVPPPGRHVLVVPAATPAEVAALLAPLARFVVAVGTDDPAGPPGRWVPHARVSPLGRMQRPPLDGPVDRRSA